MPKGAGSQWRAAAPAGSRGRVYKPPLARAPAVCTNCVFFPDSRCIYRTLPRPAHSFLLLHPCGPGAAGKRRSKPGNSNPSPAFGMIITSYAAGRKWLLICCKEFLRPSDYLCQYALWRWRIRPGCRHCSKTFFRIYIPKRRSHNNSYNENTGGTVRK